MPGGPGGGGGDGGSGEAAPAPADSPGFYYQWVYAGWCAWAPVQGQPDITTDGALWELYRVNADTGERTLVLIDCGVGPAPPEPGESVPAPPPPEPPPVPPSSVEVWDAVALPGPSIGVNPSLEGVTGLETWLWADDPTDRSVTVQLRGYELTANARATGFRWTMGDGTVYSTSSPGSEDQPAVRHTYQTKGDYLVSVEVTWEGSFTFRGHGIAETGSLGWITLSDTRPYHVFEIRSVPIG